METLQRTANRGSISTGYDIDNSCKFEIDNSESIVTTNQAAGNQKTWTWSGWLKRTELDGTQAFFGAGSTYIRFVSGDTLNVQQSGSSLTTNQVFRDTSAWYHVVWILDTTQSTEADRSRIYINGSQITSFSSATYPSQNADLDVGGLGSSSNWLQLGRWYAGGRRYSGYIAEVHYLNGTVAEPTEFGEYDEDSGIWIPKKYTGGGYGTQGYYYKFDNSSNLGEDSSGEGHDANSLNNISAANQALDSPTNNFAIISNAMRDNNELSYSTVSDGGSRFRTTSEKWVTSVSSIGVTKGKWYAEFNVIGSRPNNWWGIASMEQLNNNSGYSSAGSRLGESGKNWSIGYYQANGKLDEQQNSGYTTTSGWGSVVSQNAIVGVALDMDNHKLYMSVNNTYQNSGNPVTGANAITFDDTETVAIANTGYSLGSGNDTITGYNFGGYRTGGLPDNATDENGYGAFRYAPPSGYYALCTKNLAEYG